MAFGGGWVVLWTKPRASHMLGNHWAILPADFCLRHQSHHSSAQPAKQCSCEHGSSQVQLPGVGCLILCYVWTRRIQPWDLVLLCTILHCTATPAPPLSSFGQHSSTELLYHCTTRLLFSLLPTEGSLLHDLFLAYSGICGSKQRQLLFAIWALSTESFQAPKPPLVVKGSNFSSPQAVQEQFPRWQCELLPGPLVNEAEAGAGQCKLCLRRFWMAFVFSEDSADAGLEFNPYPGENQGNQADPWFDENGTSRTKSPLWSRGNQGLLFAWPSFQTLSDHRTFLSLQDGNSRKQGKLPTKADRKGARQHFM